MRLEGVCWRSQGQPCSERKRSTMATSWSKDSPSGVGCPGAGCEDSGPIVAMVYLVFTTSPSRASYLSALRGVVGRCYTSHVYDASLGYFSGWELRQSPGVALSLASHPVLLWRSRDHRATPRF